MDDDITTITVQRVRYDEENGISLISGADDEEEPAGYFIIQIEKGDPDGPLIEIFGEDLTQSDGGDGLGDRRTPPALQLRADEPHRRGDADGADRIDDGDRRTRQGAAQGRLRQAGSAGLIRPPYFATAPTSGPSGRLMSERLMPGA